MEKRENSRSRNCDHLREVVTSATLQSVSHIWSLQSLLCRTKTGLRTRRSRSTDAEGGCLPNPIKTMTLPLQDEISKATGFVCQSHCPFRG